MILFEDYKFEKFSTDEGLSQNTVYSIIQDSKGFLWICTQQGLNKFNGYSFIIYKNNPFSENSLPNNYVYSSFRDSDGELWFGFLNGNFASYDERNNCFKNFQIPIDEVHSKAKNLILSISEANEKNLNIASRDSGLMVYDKIKNNFLPEDKNILNSDYNISDLETFYSDVDGMTWLGTWNNGLIKIDPFERKLTRYIHNASDENSISNNRVKFISRDSMGNLWIGTSDGLNLFDTDKNVFRRYLTGNNFKSKIVLRCTAEDKNKNLWIGTINSGLIKYDVRNDNFTMINSYPGNIFGLSNDAVISLYSDNSNVLWIGTFNDGLNKLDCERKKFYSLNNLVDRSKHDTKLCISSILKDRKGNVLFGTDFEGLFVLNSENNELTNLKMKDNFQDTQKNHTVLTLFKDNKNEIWIGTLIYGLYEYNSLLNSYENYCYANSDSENKIHSISDFDNAPGDYLWIGTLTHGLFRFDKRNKKFSEYSSLRNFNKPLENREIKCLLLDRSGILWIGADLGGLNRLDFKNGIISSYTFDKTNPLSISDNYVISVCEDKSGIIWTGTMNGGLNRFDREKEIFKRYNTEHGLSGNTVCGIIEDKKGNLWLSTNNGISKFDPVNETFRNYDVSDGLQSKEFNDGAYYKDIEGIMYFGGVNGFNFFKPEDITDNPYVPEIVITDFQIFNQPVKNSPSDPFLKLNITETKEIVLSYRESVFSFEFAALIYNNPLKNQYAYMMEGFDKDWIYSGTRRFVTYTNLEPGDYVFRVRGSNNDGIWNEEGASVKIKITPPFWKTRWFKSLGVITIAGATGFTYRQKLSKIKKEKKAQEEFSKSLIDREESERKRISKELHDSIAHDILITKNKAELGMKRITDPEMKKILNEISELSSQTLNDVRSISNHLHPQILEKLGLTKAVKSVIKYVTGSTEISFTENIENIDDIQPPELRINIFRIIQECCNNIIKHSGATEASLNILKDNKTLTITVWDNGKGISKNRIDGLGLSGIEERVKLYKGELVIESAGTKGTIIVISIPYNNSN